MKTLAAAISAALSAPVTTPAVLVQIDFSTPQCWSSYQERTWSGRTWFARPLEVQNLVVQAYSLSGELLLGNHDDQAAALVLGEGITDRLITIWGYDAAAPDDVVWLATAIGGSAALLPERVVVNLRHPTDGLMSPRTYIEPETWGPVLPEAASLIINGQPLQLDRRIA